MGRDEAGDRGAAERVAPASDAESVSDNASVPELGLAPDPESSMLHDEALSECESVPADHGPAMHDLLAGVEGMQSAAGLVRSAAARSWSLSDAEVRAAAEDLTRLVSQAEAARLAVLRVLDGRPGAVAGAASGRVAATFLVGRMHVDPGKAASDVRAAYALDSSDGTMPAVGAALAEGLITAEHAGACVKAAARLPKRLQDVQVALDPADATLVDDLDLADGGEPVVLSGMQFADRWLARQARRFGVREVGRLADQLVARLAPDRAERFDPDGHLRRGVSFHRDATGMGVLRAQVTSADAVVLAAVLSAVSAPNPARACVTRDPAADGGGGAVDGGSGAGGCDGDSEQSAVVRDDRTRSMRQYDGLMMLIRAGIATRTPVRAPDDDSASVGERAGTPDAPPDTGPSDHPRTTGDGDGSDASDDSGAGGTSGADGRGSRSGGGPERAWAERAWAGADPSAHDDDAACPNGFVAAPFPPVRVLVTATLEQLIGAGILADEAAAAARGASPPTSAPPPPAPPPSTSAPPASTPPASTPPASTSPASSKWPASARAPGLAHVQHTGPISPETLALLACSATLQRVLLAPSGAPLDVGHAQRLATPAQRRALTARDGGCVIPGCACPHEGTDAHHLVPWAAGGGTDLTNLVSLCPAHHQQVHSGIWSVQLIDGLPWARPPSWVDPHRRLTRNTFHRHATTAARIGQQLRLALDHDQTDAA